MAEIESAYGDSTPTPSGSDSSRRKRSARRDGEEDAKQEEPVTFETGFDHGFENMATFNGRTVGNEGGAAASSSVQQPPPNNTTSDQQSAANASQPAPPQPAANNFDFNFDDAPSAAPAQQPAASVDLDALLSGGPKN